MDFEDLCHNREMFVVREDRGLFLENDGCNHDIIPGQRVALRS